MRWKNKEEVEGERERGPRNVTVRENQAEATRDSRWKNTTAVKIRRRRASPR